MRWIDYREKLGIGFSDTNKAKMLSNKIVTFIREDALNRYYFDSDYCRFCMMVGIMYSDPIVPQKAVANVFLNNHFSVVETISYYIAFVNTQTNSDIKHRQTLIDNLGHFLDDLRIPFEVIWDDDGAFVFPKGARELDDALVSEPLEWLSAFPKAHKTFVVALKQYSDREYIRDVADNLRKALETFLQEFLGNEKNLENNKVEISRYLGAQGVDAGITGLFAPLLNSYKNLNDRIAKHNDKVDEKLLEFLLYQTGLLIRMVITVKQHEKE